MHSSLTRIQNVFGFVTTIAFFVCALTALSVVLYPANPTAQVDVRNIRVMKGRIQQQYFQAKQQEFSAIGFDLEADLSSLFNWNTKQVFAYLSVLYNGEVKGSKYTENEAVIWDAILQTSEEAKLNLPNKRAKYNINDISGAFRDRNATLKFSWNVQPHVGVLTWGAVAITGETAETLDEDFDLEAGERDTRVTKFTFPSVGRKKVLRAVGSGWGSGEDIVGGTDGVGM